MNTLTLLLGLVTLLSFATSGLAEVVSWQPCEDAVEDAQPACTVHEVKVEPCREAASEKPCRIKLGSSASISFDYTTTFPGEHLQTRAYWASGIGLLPFAGMNTNACDSTPCPAIPGVRRNYNYTLDISSNFNRRDYDIQWKLWNEEEKECCFQFQIKLTK